MSTPFNLQPRFDEVGACRDANAILQQLNDLNTKPVNKAWNHQREQRRQLWQQLGDVANTQVAALAVLPKVAPRRPRAIKPVTHDPDGTPPEQLAAAAEARCEGNR